jgi:hypothetical protein
MMRIVTKTAPKGYHCRLNEGDYGQVSDEDRRKEWQFEGLTKILKHDILFLNNKNAFHSVKNPQRTWLGLFS